MTPEKRREIAKMIAWDEGPLEATWESNHSCGSYGCCGGGKDIDREALTTLIESALSEAYQLGQVEALREAAEQLDHENVWVVGVDFAQWLRDRASTLESTGKRSGE